MKKPPERNTCAACRYFDLKAKDPGDFTLPGEHGPSKRQCRRYPALIYKEPTEWCGEWRDIPPRL